MRSEDSNISCRDLSLSPESAIWKISADDSSRKKIKVAAYCRVSTLMETQQCSLESQRLYFQNRISSNPEWDFVGIYLDCGLSGTRAENRPELQRLLSDCQSGKVDLILTKSISRFARSTSDCLRLTRILTDIGVNLWFEKENLRTDTMDSEFFLSLLAALAEDESRSISSNIKWGIQARFKAGTYMQSVIPYGYRKIQDNLIIHSEQAAVIRQIFQSVLSGKGVSSIASDLNSSGISSPSGRKWCRTTLLRILRNPVYTGDMVYQKTFVDEQYHQHPNSGHLRQFVFPSHHEAIISREVFDLASQNIRQRGKEFGVFSSAENPENACRRSVLTGKVFCARCGRAMHRSSSGRYPVFFCPGTRSTPPLCNSSNEMEDSVKNAFLTCLNKLAWSQRLSPKSRVIDVFLRSLQESSQIQNNQRTKEIDLLLEKKKKLQRGLVSAATLRFSPEQMSEVAVVEQEISTLQQEKQRMEVYSSRESHTLKLQKSLSGWQITSIE